MVKTRSPALRKSIRSKPKQPSRPSRSRRSSIWHTFWYQGSFAGLIFILACLLVISAYGIGDQAFRTGRQGRGNVVILAAAYVAVAVISAMFCWSRIVTIKRVLRTMPKPYMPTKYLDLDKSVADHIMSEYSRTAVIAHISQATTGVQEGWGRPGTKWADKHFRTEILHTLPEMHHLLIPSSSRDISPPLSLSPLATAAERTHDQALTIFVNSYIRLVEQARYARREPSEADAEAVMKVVQVVRGTMEVRRAKEREKGEGWRVRDGKGTVDGEG